MLAMLVQDIQTRDGFSMTLVPNIIGYLIMHCTLSVTHLLAVFDNCGHLMKLLLSTKVPVSHFVSANFHCFIVKK